MRILFKVLIFLLLILLLFAGFIYAANSGRINLPLTYMLEYYLQFKGYTSKVKGLKCKNGQVTVTDIILANNLVKIKISDINIYASISGGFTSPLLTIDVDDSEVLFINKDDKELLHTKLKAIYNKLLFVSNSNLNIKFSNINTGFNGSDNKQLEEGQAVCVYKNTQNQKNYKCNLNFDEDKYLEFTGEMTDIANAQINIQNLPILFYQVPYQLFPENKALIFMNDFIKSGEIVKGNIDLVLDDKFFESGILKENNLKGGVKIKGLNLCYDNKFPLITNMAMDIDVSGTLTKFFVSQAYSSEILISNGIINMDWKGINDTRLIVKAQGHGPAGALTEFIPESTHSELRKAHIDLKKVTGNSDLEINIEIPLEPGSKNIYNIIADIPMGGINIFKDEIKIREANIHGVFNGEQVILKGKSKINSFNSDLDFIYNIEDESAYSHKLDIKTYFNHPISSKDKRKQRIFFISLLGGDSVLNIEYIYKNNKGNIKLNSDLKNLDLYFDKLGIHKEKSAPAEFILNGVFDNPNNGSIDFNIIGKNKLNITGNAIFTDDKTVITLPQINHKQTKLNGIITLKNEEVNIEIRGTILDLSNADMFQFLEKERDGAATKLKININKVYLKDNIWLDDLKLKIECDRLRCFSGYIDSKIGSRTIEMLLTAKGVNEEWLIKCSNAGALLRGLGAYDSMKAGNMLLTINASRKEVKAGEIIPILDGSFSFERFVLDNTPSLSRLVSFVSLPGFVNMISGNKNIVFSGMNGKFSFANDVLTITQSSAKGPYFNFTMNGNININEKTIDVNGYVTPALYGVSSVVGSIPIIGKIITGNKKQRGLMSAPYKFNDKY